MSPTTECESMLEKLARDAYWLFRRIVVNSLCMVLSFFCGAPASVARVEKLLVLAPEGMIGDFVLMSPFFRKLRLLLPDAFISLAVPEKTWPLAVNCPHVNEVVMLPFNSNRSLFLKIFRNLFFARQELAPRKFDTALLMTDNVDYYLGTLMMFFAGIPSRVGYGNENSAVLHPRKGSLSLEKLLTVRVPFVPGVIHQRDVFLQMLRPFGGIPGSPGELEIWAGPSDVAKAGEVFPILDGMNTRARPYFAIGVSTAARKRDWGLANYRELVRMASEKFDPFWIFTGPAEDAVKYDAIFDGAQPSFNAAGKLSLSELWLVLRRCEVYVGPDSGPAHVAAAAGCRVLEISCHPAGGSPFSINSPERFGPVAERLRIARPQIPASGCSDECRSFRPHCILNVSPGDAMTLLCELTKLFMRPKCPPP